MSSGSQAPQFAAVLFDLDGVLTGTARLHEAAWKQTFDGYLAERASREGRSFAPFSPADYATYIDGKLRTDGVRDFLASRGIRLPEGTPEDPPEAESVWGIGNRKNASFSKQISPRTVEVFPGALAVVRAVRERGLKLAVVSSSANCQAVLKAAGLSEAFDVVIDGNVARALNLPGKPAPDTFVEAARQLDVPVEKAIVVEDAEAGVMAGRAGGFGLVVGVNRKGYASALRRAGAHVVVADPWELVHLVGSRQYGPKLHRLLDSSRRLAELAGQVSVEPWMLISHAPAARLVPQLESVFALSNGYIGIRGTIDEGSPSFRTATLLNGFHETWPITYGEHAFGFSRTGQTICRVPDGTRVRLFVDDGQFDPTRGDLVEYKRVLRMDEGTVERTVVWRLADGARVRVRSRRFVSVVQRHLACITYEVEALDRPMSVTVCSELVDPEHHGAQDEDMDPRRRTLADKVLTPLERRLTEAGAILAHATTRSGRVTTCAMTHTITGPACTTKVSDEGDLVRFVASTRLVPGEPLRIHKYLAYHHSGRRSSNELCFRAAHTLEQAVLTGADQLYQEHVQMLAAFWRDADIELEGNSSIQFALRFNIFQIFQATARVEGQGMPSKGLTGEGYEGHYFWDTEIYALPFLVYQRPLTARSLLLFRYHQLDLARARARELGHKGAMFPWRTINGEDASAYYAAGTAQYHLNADIAYAIRKYVEVTGDDDFLERYGAEMLVETARLWASLGFYSERKGGQFVINGVTGPDEYSTVVDNNTFTNLMARENLLMAADTVEWLQKRSTARFGWLMGATRLAPEEPAEWRKAAQAMYVPIDPKTGVHLQDDDFLDQEPWDFEGTPPGKYPLLLHFHPLVIYRHQVIKQADVVLAAFLLGHVFTLDEKRRIFDYYDPLTTGDSSLSESIQAIMACEVGELEVGFRYLMDSVQVDLADLHGNVRDGIHVAACAGAWMAMVNGFAGLRDQGGIPAFRPRLPPHWERLRFRLRIRGNLLEVLLVQGSASYRLLEGTELTLRHDDETCVLRVGEERSFQVATFVPSASTPTPAEVGATVH